MKAEKPRDLTNLLELMQSRKALVYVAGGTDLTIHLRHRIREDDYIVDLTSLDIMKGIHESDTEIFIGALWTMSEMEKSPWFKTYTPCLSKAAAVVGSTQIRNRATLGGNVANAAQCADTIPALMVLDADVDILCLDGTRRRISISNFVEGIGLTALRSGEVIIGFWISRDAIGDLSGYAKVGSREAVTIAKINCALRIKMDNGRVVFSKISLGSLGSKAFLSEEIAKSLLGCKERDLSDEAIFDSFIKQVEVAIPGRDSLAYKRSAIKGVADSVIRQCLDLMRGNES